MYGRYGIAYSNNTTRNTIVYKGLCYNIMENTSFRKEGNFKLWKKTENLEL